MKFLFEKSPIRFVANMEAPLLLLVGRNDRRVGPSQSFELFYTLKALGKDVDLNLYDDNHSLLKTEVAANAIVNAALFFDSILNKI